MLQLSPGNFFFSLILLPGMQFHMSFAFFLLTPQHAHFEYFVMAEGESWTLNICLGYVTELLYHSKAETM